MHSKRKETASTKQVAILNKIISLVAALWNMSFQMPDMFVNNDHVNHLICLLTDLGFIVILRILFKSV